MSFPRYERYKDSGVEWLGEVPEHWAISPGRRVFEQKRDPSLPDDQQLSATQKFGVIPQALFMELEGQKVVLALKGTDAFKHVEENDFIISLRSFQGGIEKSHYRGCVSTAYTVLRNAKPIIPQYWEYLFKSSAYIGALSSVTDGIREGRSISYAQFGALELPLPSIPEQGSIVSVLDIETQKIDALIEEQRRLIELVKEKRQAVISHAVTKGLDPNVPMKGSGVAWIGEVPCSWQIKRLRMIASVRGGVAKGRDLGESETITVPYLRVANVQDGYLDLNEIAKLEITAAELERYRLRPGDVLMNEGGDFDKLGRGHIWRGEIQDCIHQNHVFSVRPRDIEPEWLTLISTAECGRFYFMTRSKQSTNLASISSSNLGQLPVPLPPPSERKEILEKVSATTNALNALIQDAVSAIALLEERRRALISAAVTGRIDVRSTLRKPVASARPYTSGFAHQLIAAEILGRCNDSHMGRTKLQKLIHLTEHHAQISELAGQYTRKRAGPLDMKAMIGVEKGLAAQSWYKTVKSDGRYRYEPLNKQGQHAKYLEPWQQLMPKIEEVLHLLGNATMRRCEIVSMLYAAWNDLLIEDAVVSDASILHEASSAERWHKSKEQIAPERWSKALQWMKDKGLVPVGYGKHTRHNAESIEGTAEVANEPA